MVTGPELLARHVERRVARVPHVLAIRRHIDGRGKELALQAQVAVVPVGVEENPEVPACGDGRQGRIVVVVQLFGRASVGPKA